MKVHVMPKINLFEMAEEDVSLKKPEKFLEKPENLQAASVEISEVGLQALENYIQDRQPVVEHDFQLDDSPNAINMDYWMKIGQLSGDYINNLNKNGEDINIEDLMAARMSAYESLYYDIIKAHENGDREGLYSGAGWLSVTLEEDLASLDQAFNRSMDEVEAVIFVRQVNKTAVKTAARAMKDFYRQRGIPFIPKPEEKWEDYFDFSNTELRDAAREIMQEARDQFLKANQASNFQKGNADKFVKKVYDNNYEFTEKIKKLFS